MPIMRLLGTQAEPESETAETRDAHGSIVWLNTPQSRANTTESRSWGQDLGGLLDIRQIDFEAKGSMVRICTVVHSLDHSLSDDVHHSVEHTRGEVDWVAIPKVIPDGRNT